MEESPDFCKHLLPRLLVNRDARVIQSKLRDRFVQALKVICINRENTGKHHGLRRLETRQCLNMLADMVERITHVGFRRRLHTANDIAYLPSVPIHDNS